MLIVITLLLFLFAGELGKLDMLQEGILHKCIKQLLEKKRHSRGIKDMAEDLECVCQIMRTCGHILDTEKGKHLMHQYFERMKVLMDNPELPSRIRFMLQDVLELREKKVGHLTCCTQNTSFYTYAQYICH